jgi:tetratricopeptide (TPR) repeat protein
MNRPYHAVLLITLWLAACQGAVQQEPNSPSRLGTEALGRHHFPITTKVPAAQTLFDRGLAWCYGFHHAEAIAHFAAAAQQDPTCAMAHWGQAYAAGPHINNMEMTPDSAQAAHEHSQRAIALANGVTPLERALINAVARRYAWPPPQERKSLDLAYAEAMRDAYAAHGSHPDVAALFAESLMNLRPWDLWQSDGTPQPGTEEIVAVLERLLASHPNHPQACHLYIHAVEASRNPERAIPAAERLAALVPGAGHLVHMPSHTFIRVGRYADAAAANRAAIAVDKKIVARTGRTGFYELYRAHNFHFLVYAAMFEGRATEAIASAREMVTELPEAVVQAMPDFLESFLGVPYHALVRFGKWDEILREPEPAEWKRVTRTLHHYARGIALAATDRVAAAEREQELFTAALAAVPTTRFAGINPASAVLAVGKELLAGEIAFRRGEHDAAFAALRQAVHLDATLNYDEPWGWMMPPSHALGALLLEAGRVAEAEAVYRADLERHKNNGWALLGLAECLRARGATHEVAATEARVRQAWQRAQVEIKASCFCRRM